VDYFAISGTYAKKYTVKLLKLEENPLLKTHLALLICCFYGLEMNIIAEITLQYATIWEHTVKTVHGRTTLQRCLSERAYNCCKA
jgi:hypothetical protein